MGLLHRHLTRFIAIDVVLLILLLSSTETSGSGSILLFHVLLGVVLIPLGIISVIVMHRRARGGVRLGIATLGFIGAAFMLLGTIGGIGYIFGNSSEILLPVVLGLLGITTLRRIPTMRNQSYIMWYRGSRDSGFSEIIYDKEILATCPNCHEGLVRVEEE